MSKCWLHGETAETKPSKPLKEVPLHRDAVKENFARNLEMVLASSRKTREQKIKDLDQKELEVAEIKQELSTRVSNLEKQVIALLKKENIDLAELKTSHAQLSPFFKKLKLTNTWQYVEEIFQDYFNSVENLEKNLENQTFEDIPITIPTGSTSEQELKNKQLELDRAKEEINTLKSQNETLINRIMGLDLQKKKKKNDR